MRNRKYNARLAHKLLYDKKQREFRDNIVFQASKLALQAYSDAMAEREVMQDERNFLGKGIKAR